MNAGDFYAGHDLQRPSDAASIDKTSATIVQFLESEDISSEEILKLRLSVEAVMSIWAEELGEDTPCLLMKNQRLRKTSLVLQAGGKSVDPTRYQDDLLLSVSNNPNIVSALGLPAEYRYSGGVNELKLHLPAKKASSIRQVLIAIVSAVVIGLILRNFAPQFGDVITETVISPLSRAITNALCLIAGPLIFLSMLIVSTVLALACPPIPGGALTAVMVLFTQLGIPLSAMAITATILTFSDYVGTACNISMLQQELLISAKKLQMMKEPKEKEQK